MRFELANSEASPLRDISFFYLYKESKIELIQLVEAWVRGTWGLTLAKQRLFRFRQRVLPLVSQTVVYVLFC
jgi:hypothetical protein